MQTLKASEARANFYRLIDEAAESHEPIMISGKRSSAILISAEDWSAIQETLYLLSVPGMRESIKEGMAESLTESAKELDW
ncbi:MAG: type II toxin-antitoxin system Phd/YefM family antitoxin [Methylococcaceae bacterium]